MGLVAPVKVRVVVAAFVDSSFVTGLHYLQVLSPSRRPTTGRSTTIAAHRFDTEACSFTKFMRIACLSSSVKWTKR
jgi:hypothetical protein